MSETETEKKDRSGVKSLLRVVGSLWFGALLFLLLMVAMGSATVFETNYGTERVGLVFYHSWWFHGLLLLVGVNTLASLLARLPFTKKQIPFAVTHLSILLILIGALITQYFSTNGRMAIAETETTSTFTVPGDVLALRDGDGNTETLRLNDVINDPFEPIPTPLPGSISMDDLRLEVVQYMPDLKWEQEMRNDNPSPHLAFEVAMLGGDEELTAWAFGDTHGHHSSLGGRAVKVLVVSDKGMWQQMTSAEGDKSQGKIHVEIGGKSYEFKLEDIDAKPAAIGETGIQVKLLRYMPHAVVGPEKKIVNASQNPVNPAVEVEFIGPEDAKQSRLAFAKFPDFMKQMGRADDNPIKLRFTSTASQPLSAPIELMVGPAGELFVRFAWSGASMEKHKVTMNQPVQTPWPNQLFVVKRRFDNARTEFTATQPDPIRSNRQPGVKVKAVGGGVEEEFWVQRHQPRRFRAGGKVYSVSYERAVKELDFQVRLNYFRVGHYPGGTRPRSFESGITIIDPATGREQGRTISMNHPTSFGGYTFYQSSYQRGRNGMISVLQVASDPGRPIVFIGYTGIMVGMILVLIQRMAQQRKKEKAPPAKEDPTEGGAES